MPPWHNFQMGAMLKRGFLILPLLVLVASGAATTLEPQASASDFHIEISFGASARSEPITGRVYVAISRDDRSSPIDQADSTGVPLFGRNVENLRPGEVAVIGAGDLGHPIRSLKEVPPGEYWVQAFINIYTRFPRADGSTVWLHMDQWEGQDWKRSPGNLFSEPVKVRISPSSPGMLKLVCDNVIPPIQAPADTELVKRFKFQSQILSKWWGHPIYLGATVLLPKDYDKHRGVRYPVNYVHGHFSTAAPGGFGRGQEFDRYWLADDTPRFIYVTLQHPSPYYDDSYGVNSANNGPYGDAIMQELIPAVEGRFRVIREPWARLLSGGSTGGWIALAHQVFYPDFYGGVWASCPDPVDFRSHQIVNIYDDDNAYWLDTGWTKVERPNRRRPDGNVVSMMKDENWYELVAGDRSRSGGQWDIWEATFGPVGPDGYPVRLWDKSSGKINNEVAETWKKYDLRLILERNWKTLGSKLAGKLHVYVGDMDSYYLNNAVHKLDEFLRSTTNPPYGGEVVFQPLAPHCWGPRPAELMEKMTTHLGRTAPAGADVKSWKYQ
jgi:hypothetical protein